MEIPAGAGALTGIFLIKEFINDSIFHKIFLKTVFYTVIHRKTRQGAFLMEEPIFSPKRKQRIMDVAGFSIFYLLSFFLLEQRHVRHYLLDSSLDALIPFCEYFIVPYLLWFVYVGLTVGWFTFFCDSDGEYFRLSRSLALSGTVFLVISALLPNGQSLRPCLSNCDNLFQQAVQLLYRVDTPTNVFPSIHVCYSLVCWEAILQQKTLREHPILISAVTILTALIIAATLFLKQHTLVDVIGGLVLAGITDQIFYRSRVTELAREPQLARILIRNTPDLYRE